MKNNQQTLFRSGAEAFDPDKMEQYLSKRLRKPVKVDPPPKEFTDQNLKLWSEMNFVPVFMPEMESEHEYDFDGLKPSKWFFDRASAGSIAPVNGIEPARIIRGWYLVDFTVCDVIGNFSGDPLGRIIFELRKRGELGKLWDVPEDCRFALTPREWRALACPAVAANLDIRSGCRLERYIEYFVIGNLFDFNRGRFGNEWFADPFCDYGSLFGGYCRAGGLSYINSAHDGLRSRDIFARPLFCFAS